jgi:phenylpyruvate tautomerase PptA (4-oxalocrotonate tautomerase family)
MPTYVCVVEPGLLNDEQKQRIASAITRLHGEATRAPTWLVQVVIDESDQRQRYLAAGGRNTKSGFAAISAPEEPASSDNV